VEQAGTSETTEKCTYKKGEAFLRPGWGQKNIKLKIF
jgi:hypothetical protein